MKMLLVLFFCTLTLNANSQTGKIDSCEKKFIKSIFKDVFDGKEEWIVAKITTTYKSWYEIISSKLFFEIYLGSYRSSYKDIARKNYNDFMVINELKYFRSNSFDGENDFVKSYLGNQKDTFQYNIFVSEGLSRVLKKYFNKKNQLRNKYKPIQMQLFWYLFDNRIRVVTPQQGRSYYILYDCATTFFPKASYASYF